MFLSFQVILVLLKKSDSSKFIILCSYTLLCGKVFLHLMTNTVFESGRHNKTVYKQVLNNHFLKFCLDR